MREAYLDNSATTPVCSQAAQKVLEMMTVCYGNPSSLHTKGIEAQKELMAARKCLAEKLHCRPDELYFTSGGTEGNNLALFGAAYARRRLGNRLVISATEHSSVIESAAQLEKEGFEVVLIGTDEVGRIDETAFAAAINEKTILVSMEMVNNETGAIQPVASMEKAVRTKKAPAQIHIDAVQAFGKIPVFPLQLGAHLLTISAHKIFGPKGVGALFVRKDSRILPRTFGGEQEKKLRPGTEAAPFIAGFAAAVQALPEQEEALKQIRLLRDSCLDQLRSLKGVEINSGSDALPYVLNFSVRGIRSETMLHHLAAYGVFVSSGSACAKGKRSHVLEAMGLDRARIDSAIRVSFGHQNTMEDVTQLIGALREGIEKLARARG